MGACIGKLSGKKEATTEKTAEAAAPMTKSVLITGASGNVGKATIAALAKYPEITVKAGVRDPEKSKDLALGASTVSVVAADPLNAAEIGEALKGVDAVFVVTPGHIDRAKIVIAAVDAAKAAGVKHVVVVSVLTAELADTVFGKQFTEIEAHVKAAGVPYTLLRLPLFLDNQYGNVGSIKGQGTWYDAIEPEKPFTPAAVQDIAEVAAKILSAPAPHANKTYKIGAPSDTFANLAKYYTEAVGKPVTYTPVPYDGVKAALTGMGFQEWQADGILDLEKLINSDSPVTNDPQCAKDVEAILGRPATSFKAWVEGNAAAFK